MRVVTALSLRLDSARPASVQSGAAHQWRAQRNLAVEARHRCEAAALDSGYSILAGELGVKDDKSMDTSCQECTL
jgi:hypothetical protein